MFMKHADGYGWEDMEGANTNYTFTCQLNPKTYKDLLLIAHENKIMTFDMSYMVNYVIEHFHDK